LCMDGCSCVLRERDDRYRGRRQAMQADLGARPRTRRSRRRHPRAWFCVGTRHDCFRAPDLASRTEIPCGRSAARLQPPRRIVRNRLREAIPAPRWPRFPRRFVAPPRGLRTTIRAPSTAAAYSELLAADNWYGSSPDNPPEDSVLNALRNVVPRVVDEHIAVARHVPEAAVGAAEISDSRERRPCRVQAAPCRPHVCGCRACPQSRGSRPRRER